MIKTGMDYKKFIYHTPICKQRPANNNNRPNAWGWWIKRDEDWTQEEKDKFRKVIFNQEGES